MINKKGQLYCIDFIKEIKEQPEGLQHAHSHVNQFIISHQSQMIIEEEKEDEDEDSQHIWNRKNLIVSNNAVRDEEEGKEFNDVDDENDVNDYGDKDDGEDDDRQSEKEENKSLINNSSKNKANARLSLSNEPRLWH